MLQRLAKVISSILIILCLSHAHGGSLEGYGGNWWVNLGLGAGATLDTGSESDRYEEDGISWEASFNMMPDDQQLATFRVMSTGDFFDNFYDLGPLYGMIYKTHDSYISASAGLAYTEVAKTQINQSGPARTVRTIGVPLEIQAFMTPYPSMGAGLIGFGDINDKVSLVGVALSVQFGVLN